jgi:predicted Zn-dependent protease
VELDPANAYNQNYLGVALFEAKRREQALTHLQAAVDLDPDYTAAHFNLAVVLSTGETPDLNASRLYYQRALTLGSARSEWLDQVLELAP